jgi:nifR3 family TIM-barrel protein
MGCPVRKVTRIGGGSAMMTELRKTADLVRGMVEAVKIPVTAKMRLGWDRENLTAPDLARVLEDVGVAAVFVHGRTRAQGFGGTVSLAGIRTVVEAVRRIPVIGNGDVTTPEAAKTMLVETGCAGVSIGRGAFYNPWIFRQTRHYLRTGELASEPSLDERVRVMCRHLDLMIEIYGEETGCRMFRKVAAWYAKRLGPVIEFRRRLAVLRTRDGFYAALAAYQTWRSQFCNADGELLPKYRQQKLVASFMRPETDSPPGAVRVPKGPIEVW